MYYDSIEELSSNLTFPRKSNIEQTVSGRIIYLTSDDVYLKADSVPEFLSELVKNSIETIVLIRKECQRQKNPVGNDSSELETVNEGIRFLKYYCFKDEIPNDRLEGLNYQINKFLEYFAVYRPSYILVSYNEYLALPAYIAATQLGISFLQIQTKDKLTNLANVLRELSQEDAGEEIINQECTIDLSVEKSLLKSYFYNQRTVDYNGLLQKDDASESRKIPFIKSEFSSKIYGTTLQARNSQQPNEYSSALVDGLEWSIDVRNLVELDVFFDLSISNKPSDTVAHKQLILKIEFVDRIGSSLTPCESIPKSQSVGNYVYVSISNKYFTKVTLPIPTHAHLINLKLERWQFSNEIVASNTIGYAGLKSGVSVIIPSFKGENTITECLQSLALQSLSPELFEVIVILNGEKDNTEHLINAFRKKNPKLELKLLNSIETGAGAARNMGIAAARRKYITFVDDDDLVSQNFLKGLMAFSSSDRVVLSNIEDFANDDFFESPIDKQISANQGREDVPYSEISSAVTLNACKLIPTHFAKSINYNTRLKSGEDVDYWTRLVNEFEPKFCCVEESSASTYFRRVRDNSVSRQPESFEFNVKQRLEVVSELEKIKAQKHLESFVRSKINAQLGFVNRYLVKYPEKWSEFRVEAESLRLGVQTFQYVNKGLSKTLVISYCFPPYIDTAGIVCAKRIIKANRPVDVISNSMQKIRQVDPALLGIVNPYIGVHTEIKDSPSFSNWNVIKAFCEKSLKIAEANISKYTEIFSRSMWPASHFAAALIKMRNPHLKWTAEFSDPLLVDIHGNNRTCEIDSDWLSSNGFLEEIDKKGFRIEKNSLLFYWCEMLPYIFANECVFTNHSQKAYMLRMVNDKNLIAKVEREALVSQHPTLPRKFYKLSSCEYSVDKSTINIAYFGSFYATRGVGEILEALSKLENDTKRHFRFHIFTQDPDSISLSEEVQGNVVLNKMVPYLDFLSVSNNFDCLIVNDAQTKGFKWVNPYLPSKLSDYKGSSSKIWALCEEGSELENNNNDSALSFKSRIGDISSSMMVLKQMLGSFKKVSD